jgi:hypothetical protein
MQEHEVSRWIVTIKLRKSPLHDPRNKQTGACLVSSHCTDITGEHHSFMATGSSEAEIRAAWQGQYHITRIEKV